MENEARNELNSIVAYAKLGNKGEQAIAERTKESNSLTTF